MAAPREEGAEVTAHTVIRPLDLHERFGRQLEDLDIAAVQSRQAAFIARRLGVRASHANILVGLVFGEVAR